MKKQSKILAYTDKTPKILILTNCCKTKLDYPTKARKLYRGALFRKIMNLSNKINSDIRILSAKYGLIGPNEVISPYEKKLKYKKEILAFQISEIPKLEKIMGNYSNILVIMSKTYRSVFDPLIKSNIEKFKIIKSNKGIGEYLHILTELNKKTKKEILEDIKNV